MRVSSFQIHDLVQKSLQKQGKDYAEVIQQMSSGHRINNISDDPLGSVNLIGMERDKSSLQQFIKNGKAVVSALEKSESYTNTSMENLFRAQELVTRAVTDSSSEADRQAYAVELESIKNTLVDLANARDEDGNYLFSGSQSQIAPIQLTATGYAFMGDAREREIPVSQNSKIASVVSMADTYLSGGNFFDKLDNFINDLNTGSTTIAATGPDILNSLSTTQSEVGKLQTKIGTRVVNAESISRSQEDLMLSNEKIMGEIKDLDYVDAINKINKLEMSMTATQKTYSKINELTLFNYI